ncbi:MAG: signal transduction histidine kinase [Crocinitomicaceae bacterium]|jgi:signal transduction histidine kinase
MLRFIVVSILCFGTVFSAQAQTNYSKSEIKKIGCQIFLLEDEKSSMTIEDVINSGKFIKSKVHVPNMGVTESSFWLKIPIKNGTNEEDLILMLEQPFIDLVELYSPMPNGAYKETTLGEHQNFSNRKYHDPNYLFDIHIAKGESRTFYMKVSGKEQIQLPLSIGPKKLIFEKRKNSDLLSGIYFGMIIVMMLYNLFIYFTTRDNSYLYYVVYIVLIGLTQTSLQGYPFQYLWPNLPWMSEHSLFIFPSLVGVSALVFMRNFLQVKKTLPKLDKLMPVFHIVYAACIILAIGGNYKLSYNIIEINAMVVSVYMLTVTIVIVRRGYRPGRYFLIAWSTFLLGVIIFVMKDQGVLPYNGFTRYTMHIGSALEVILLSFALADRINILKAEKEESQAKLLGSSLENERIIREQNTILEEKVKARTLELEQSNVELNETYNDLKQTQSKLVESEKMASLGQLTAGIAHEINNPINFVTANVAPLKRDIKDLLELIDKYESLDPKKDIDEQLAVIRTLAEELEIDFLKTEIDELISGIGEGAERTAEIVKGLRNFSRLDEGDLKFANVNDGIESTIRILDNEIHDNQTIVMRELGELDAIECYPGKLNQLFMNLLTNSIQAIKSKKDIEGVIEIKSVQKEQAIEIRFKDNGMGMSEETKNKIFEPFFTTKDVGEGTGLGLSIAYSIVEMHNGTIKVESELGHSTEFIIQLPLKQS